MNSYLLQFFEYAHLRDATMRKTSKRFAELARWVHDHGDNLEGCVVAVEAERDMYVKLHAPKNPEAEEAARKLTQAATTMEATGLAWQGLRKILEAKDCAVRALLFKADAGQGARP